MESLAVDSYFTNISLEENIEICANMLFEKNGKNGRFIKNKI